MNAFGNIPTDLLDFGFSLRIPVEYTVQKSLQVWERFGEEYLERGACIVWWAFDGPDMSGAIYRQFVEVLLIENTLIERYLLQYSPPDEVEPLSRTPSRKVVAEQGRELVGPREIAGLGIVAVCGSQDNIYDLF